MAVPVRRGQWITVMLTDGSVVTVEACGDEHAHYWQSADGQRYLKDEATGAFRAWQESDAKRIASKRSQVSQLRQRKTSARRASAESLYKGQRKGLIILVQFSDRKFKSADPAAFFNSVANEQGFSQQGFKSSVKDYFRAQSGGAFEIDFDVVGPVTMPNGYAYYGGNNDYKVGEMIHDACVGVDSTVDFSNYDWDKDGEAEEVYVLYAGYGEADNTSVTNYIWPHMYALSAYDYYKGTTLRLDNTVIDVYACSNELDASSLPNGIGTICHEFSHCLGLPDMYDILDGGNYGMGSWDLMDYGSYNDDGFTPSSYTGYEKMVVGWSTPMVLNADTVVSNLAPVSEGGQSAIVYNPANPNEYYILDNRQLTGYDAGLPGHGLIVVHIDYDEQLWEANLVNSTGYDAVTGLNNTHQRATIFHADNNDSYRSEATDPYPYLGNDSLTSTSLPAATLYNRNLDNTNFLGRGLWNIRENADGTMSFRFGVDTTVVVAPETNPSGSTLLNETFDQCQGTGGNDGMFAGSVASATFVPDCDGWQAIFSYGGDGCARFGNSKSAGTGIVITPTFTLPGDTVTFSFRAAGWNANGDGTDLYLGLSNSSFKFVESGSSDIKLTMTKGQWTTYTVRIVGEGKATVTFSPSKRFFLDDVKAAVPVSMGITSVATPWRATAAGRIYSISGQYMGTDLQALPHGIYIIDGKKVVR
jgi:M6 family metalloprotease-like protein